MHMVYWRILGPSPGPFLRMLVLGSLGPFFWPLFWILLHLSGLVLTWPKMVALSSWFSSSSFFVSSDMISEISLVFSWMSWALPSSMMPCIYQGTGQGMSCGSLPAKFSIRFFDVPLALDLFCTREMKTRLMRRTLHGILLFGHWTHYLVHMILYLCSGVHFL